MKSIEYKVCGIADYDSCKSHWLGYVVTVYHDGEPVEEYKAGNHRLESTLETTNPLYCLPKKTLRKFAKQTALAMAEERGITSISEERLVPHTIQLGFRCI